MIILDSIYATHIPQGTCVLTIGSFDGVHRGHVHLLSQARSYAGSLGTVCVITFSNHPTHILPNRKPVPLLSSAEEKLRLLEEQKVDVVYCIPFTKDLSSLQYDEFIQLIMNHCPFNYLLLGSGARLGKNREGTAEKLRNLSDQMGFKSVFIDKQQVDEEDISSNAIREAILKGDMELAKALLGHPYSIQGRMKNDQFIFAHNRCVPPDGVYNVKISDYGCARVHIDKGILILPVCDLSQKVVLSF